MSNKMVYATQQQIDAGVCTRHLCSLIDSAVDKNEERVIYSKDATDWDSKDGTDWVPFIRVVPGKPIPDIVRIV